MSLLTLFVSLFLILYTYLMYPLVLLVAARFIPKRPNKLDDEKACPLVSVVVAAYNEEKVIEEKIKNTLELSYPADKLEIFIGSDGSADGTDEICRAFEQVRFERIEPRQGKANVLNTLIPQAKGEIVLLSDANTVLRPNALRAMVAHFEDSSVGGVCGKLILESETRNLESYEAVYWQYETFIKEQESRVHSTIGANGGIYAIRKSVFSNIPKDTIIDDFLISLNILAQRKRLVFEKDAIAYEDVSKNFRDEFWRKVRVGSGNFQTLIRNTKTLLQNGSPFVRFAYLSHKVVRWIIPLLLMVVYLSLYNLRGQGIWPYLFWTYNLCIAIAIAGVLLKLKLKVVNMISYLFVFNFALLYGYIRYCLGLQKGTWRKAAR